MLALYWRAIRGRFISVSLLSVVLGAIAARREHGVEIWPEILLVLTGAALVHLGSNLWNDYADELNGTDPDNKCHTSFNGGSRVIQEGFLTAISVKKAALVCYASALAIALCFVPSAGWGVPALTMLGIGCGIGYSSPPLWFSGHGLGELIVALCFGPLLAVGTALALTGSYVPSAFVLSLPLGLLVAAILLLNEIPDIPADASVGKKTIPVLRGRDFALSVFFGLPAVALLTTTLGTILNIMPIQSYWTWATIPLVFLLYRLCRRGMAERQERLAVGAVVLHLSFGLLLILGLLPPP